ncbi:MAG: hypothetical protein IJM53_04465 [Lachnospiraceae bacterium]|nr:hypothetical protein [Lachnospiraceae bacterium]
MALESNNNRLAKLIKDTMEHPMNYYVPPFKMLDRVYCIPGKFVNQYLVDTGDGGLVLIDSVHRLGFDPTAWKSFHQVAIRNFIDAYGSECGLK